MAVDISALAASVAASVTSGLAKTYVEQNIRQYAQSLDEEIEEEEMAALLQEEARHLQQTASRCPPSDALYFALLTPSAAESSPAGLFGAEGTLHFQIEVVNRASFLVHQHSLEGKAVVRGSGYSIEYAVRVRDEHSLEPRTSEIVNIAAPPSSPLPELALPNAGYLAASLEFEATTVVEGPWDGTAATRIALLRHGWVPIFSELGGGNSLAPEAIQLLVEDWMDRTVRSQSYYKKTLRLIDIADACGVPLESATAALVRLAQEDEHLAIVVANPVVKIEFSPPAFLLL